jgi:hypothetical protein
MGCATIDFTDIGDLARTSFVEVSGLGDQPTHLEPEIRLQNSQRDCENRFIPLMTQCFRKHLPRSSTKFDEARSSPKTEPSYAKIVTNSNYRALQHLKLEGTVYC